VLPSFERIGRGNGHRFLPHQFAGRKVRNGTLLRRSRESGSEEVSWGLDKACERMARLVELTQTAANLEGLWGIEGEAGRGYFGVVDWRIGVEKGSFFMKERTASHRWTISMYCFRFIYNAGGGLCGSAGIGGARYDGGISASGKPGRPRLALDLIEELRSVLPDRLALTLINRRQIKHPFLGEKMAIGLLPCVQHCCWRGTFGAI
jgi:CRISP-associated protein Cas1